MPPGKARTWAPQGCTPVTRVSGRTGQFPVAGMACLKPGRPGRFFYRLRVHRRRKASGPACPKTTTRAWSPPRTAP
jgi:hypothetical protein